MLPVPATSLVLVVVPLDVVVEVVVPPEVLVPVEATLSPAQAPNKKSALNKGKNETILDFLIKPLFSFQLTRSIFFLFDENPESYRNGNTKGTKRRRI
jgi:hypothetical protein